MSNRLILVSPDAALIRSVKAAFAGGAGLIQINQLSDDDGRLEAQFQPGAVIIDCDTNSGVQTAFEKISEARRRFPSTPVVAMGNEMSAQLVLAALRAGAADFMDRNASAEQIQLAVQACLAHHGEPRRQARSIVAGVLSAVPGEQDRDFSLNLAVRTAMRAPSAQCLYVDLSLPASEAGMALDLSTKFGVAEAIQELARLDRAFLESAVARDKRSGLYVLPLSHNFQSEAAPLEAESLGALFHLLQNIFDRIVINYGPFARQRPLLEMAGSSARFFLCCNQRFSTIRGSADLLRWLAQSKTDIVPDLVVMECGRGRLPSAADICKSLRVTNCMAVALDPAEMTANFNDATPPALIRNSRLGTILDQCLEQMGLPREQEADFTAQLRGWLGLTPRMAVS